MTDAEFIQADFFGFFSPIYLYSFKINGGSCLFHTLYPFLFIKAIMRAGEGLL